MKGGYCYKVRVIALIQCIQCESADQHAYVVLGPNFKYSEYTHAA